MEVKINKEKISFISKLEAAVGLKSVFFLRKNSRQHLFCLAAP